MEFTLLARGVLFATVLTILIGAVVVISMWQSDVFSKTKKDQLIAKRPTFAQTVFPAACIKCETSSVDFKTVLDEEEVKDSVAKFSSHDFTMYCMSSPDSKQVLLKSFNLVTNAYKQYSLDTTLLDVDVTSCVTMDDETIAYIASPTKQEGFTADNTAMIVIQNVKDLSSKVLLQDLGFAPVSLIHDRWRDVLMVVDAADRSKLTLYKRNQVSNRLTKLSTITISEGTAACFSLMRNTMAIGCPQNKLVAVYKYTNGNWAHEYTISPDLGDSSTFGSQVSVNKDQTRIAITDSFSQRVHIYSEANAVGSPLQPASSDSTFGDALQWDGDVLYVSGQEVITNQTTTAKLPTGPADSFCVLTAPYQCRMQTAFGVWGADKFTVSTRCLDII